MFNKLRNRFLVVNMVIITVIMLIAFALIYTITYQNVRNDIMMDLGRAFDFYKPSDGMAGEPHQGGDGGPPHGGKDKDMMWQPERTVSFCIQTDYEWNMTATDSRFDLDDDFYANAVKKVAAQGSGYGQFSLDGNEWAFKVLDTMTGNTIVFLDVTAQQTILTNLVYTFLAVALAMLIVIYFTSRYFANRSIAPVKEAFDKQKRFIADASHELKTPLAVINTNADVLLANRDDVIRDQAKWLHHIKSETERMKTLTNDLLYLTEIDDTREKMFYAPFNLSEAVESVILTMEAVIFEKNISLDYEIEPDLVINGNGEQIKQVVMILLDNAIKYANDQGSITLALKKRAADIQLKVTNTGEGIAPEHLDRIFDRFYRADRSRSRKHGGYGLGLAIAKSIVEQHKGKIYAKSVQGQSTSFYVLLA
ncbi:sensor histidine kinase [Paenibacillus harenae]|uniref:histidine kinase n=1 Tax=Paenibacillus harenae TaxID=306543 RepID=A0ABT9U246_PAEHA|nr:HAMP domain-containing sensor histidine kinase [Paenibacillus harenae]MDQ0113337.1 signal transduction histidine kinase [Paenibacillus harenae]